MQTFLPYPDFDQVANCLDRQRLGKQRVEAWQILRASSGLTKGWANHPATVMWRGFEYTLSEYGIAMCKRWKSLGFKDTMQIRFEIIRGTLEPSDAPWWIESSHLHLSHQSNLVSKFPQHYLKFFPNVKPGIPYVWPAAMHTTSSIEPDEFTKAGIA